MEFLAIDSAPGVHPPTHTHTHTLTLTTMKPIANPFILLRIVVLGVGVYSFLLGILIKTTNSG